MIAVVYSLLLLLPLERFFVSDVYNMHIKLSDYAALVCILLFIFRFLTRPRKDLFPASAIKPLFVFVFVNIVIFLIRYPDVMGVGSPADMNSPGPRSIKVTVWCIYSVLLALAVCYAVKTKRELRNCILFFLLGAMASTAFAFISLFGFILGKRIFLKALVGRAGGFVGIKATFSEPSYYANYMSLVLPTAMSVFIFRIYRFGLFFSILSCFMLFAGNYLSFSTTGLVGGIVIMVLLPFFVYRYRLLSTREGIRFATIFFVTLYIVFLLGVAFNIDFVRVTVATFGKIFWGGTARASGRVLAYRIFRDYPFIGVGPGNWEWVAESGDYIQKVREITGMYPSYNCLYWEILVDLGILGFIPFVWIFVRLFRSLSGSILRTDDRFLRAVLIGFRVGFMALLVEYYASFNFYRIHVWAVLGLALAAIRLSREEGTKA